MNNKFHMGGYLFWVGWFFSCLFFFFARVKPKPKVIIEEKTEPIKEEEINPES